MLGLCTDDAIVEALRGIFDFAQWKSLDYNLDTFMRAIAAAVAADSFWVTARLAVCTGPFALCGSLSQVLAAGRGVHVFVYQGLAFHAMAPLDQTARAQYYQPLLRACRPSDDTHTPLSCTDDEAMARQRESRFLVATNSPLNAAQVKWQTGVDVPVVRFLGLYARMRFGQSADIVKDVLVFRCMLWNRPVGHAFRGLVKQFSAAAPVTVSFRFLEANEQMAYGDLVRYRAVFLFPWDSELVTFHELYSAGVPLLLPDLAWLAKWQPFIPWGSTDQGSNDIGAERNDWTLVPEKQLQQYRSMGGWPCAPWFQNRGTLKGSWEELKTGALNDKCSRFWMQETHFFRFPHILHVSSIPQLVLTPLTYDPFATSRAMEAFNKVTLRDALNFYRWSLAWFLHVRN